MTEISQRSFGYLVAFVIPGWLVVLTVGQHSPLLRSWIGINAESAPTVGGFLYVTLASLAAGMIVSAIRWLVLDTIHHWTGVEKPNWDFSLLQANRAAVVTLVEQHYRFYQHYGNLLVAIVVALANARAIFQSLAIPPALTTIAIGGLIILLFAASRDSLTKYYARTAALLR